MKAEDIQAGLERAFPGAKVLVRDLTGTEDHYQAVVGAREFEGQGLVQQHQMVYRALGEAVGGDIHALMLKTCLPDEFDAAVAASAP